ncbi:MAG: amidohydrolase [Chloroflexi bacterium]|nr:MAG: amidohydrolase [Chloroflexota bacterium]
MIIDTHVHVWEIDPPRYPVGPTAPNWTALPDEPGTADELLAEMDAHGVDCSVLVQTSWSTWDNGYIADSVARFPDRFVGMGLLDPLVADNAGLARYWVTERGLAGFRFHPMYYPEQKVLLRPENDALWEELAGLDVILQFHLRAAQADQLAAIATRYPHLRLIVDHMGYPEVGESVAAAMAAFQPILELASHDNICFKLSDVKGRSKQPFPFADVHPFIRALLDAFGTERTIWGTGYPGHHRTRHHWLSLADELRLIQEGLPFLTPAQSDRILGETAAQLFRLGVD